MSRLEQRFAELKAEGRSRWSPSSLLATRVMTLRCRSSRACRQPAPM